MEALKHKPRIAVVSPFLDRSYGTERAVIEWLVRLTDEYDFHIYSQHVQDLDLSKFTWHRVPKLPGPHLFNFLWWFVANHIWRAWDFRFRGLRYDLVFSPGPNCLDPDAISVHILFAEFLRQVRPELDFMRNPIRIWPRLLHRRIYYRLAIVLERRIYRNPKLPLLLISARTAGELKHFYGREGPFPVLYAGVDQTAFNPSNRIALRGGLRKQLGLADNEFTLLLIGNDWRKKGLPVLLDALTQLRDLRITLLVVTRERDPELATMVRNRSLGEAVRFLPGRKDVEVYYAAADLYVGPSLEDTYAIPPIEAMACGLPAIISSRAGASDVVTDRVDALILKDPTDAAELAELIRSVHADGTLRAQLGEHAAVTARQFTWESNARDVSEVFKQILLRKTLPTADTLAQVS